MGDREIYPRAPLRLVAFELRTPTVPTFASPESALPAFEQLKDIVPIIGPANPTIEMGSGDGPPTITPGPLRLLDRRRQLSIVLGPRAIAVETSAYHRFEEFEKTLERTLDAVSKVADVAGMVRIGLRYIDEIRVEGVSEPSDWKGLINGALLGAAQLNGEFNATSFNGLLEYALDSQTTVNLRYGALRGRVVDSSGPLRIEPEYDGPFFLIDIDSFWTAPEEELPEFNVDEALEICTRLRLPVRSLFEAAITEKLREDFRRPRD